MLETGGMLQLCVGLEGWNVKKCGRLLNCGQKSFVRFFFYYNFAPLTLKKLFLWENFYVTPRYAAWVGRLYHYFFFSASARGCGQRRTPYTSFVHLERVVGEIHQGYTFTTMMHKAIMLLWMAVRVMVI